MFVMVLVIFDVTIVIVVGCHKPHPYETGNLTVETKDLEYYIKLTEKAAAGVERTDLNSEGSSTLGKMLLNSIAYRREIVCQGRIN